MTLERKTESGAALITGLILLTVMTVLAVSTMSTASLELTMAGNSQFKENAFQNAESGIELSLRNWEIGGYRLYADDETDTLVDQAGIEAEIGGTGTMEGCFGASMDEYRTYFMALQSTGTSERNARSVNTLGLARCVPK